MVADTIRANFPQSQHEKLIAAIEKTDFILPPTAEEYEQELTQHLQRMRESEEANLKKIKTISAQDLYGAFSNLIKRREAQKTEQDNPYASAAAQKPNRYCGQFNFSPVSDANYTTLGSIILSFSTAKGDTAHQTLIIAHELGHTVHKELGEGSPEVDRFVAGLRKCISEQQPSGGFTGGFGDFGAAGGYGMSGGYGSYNTQPPQTRGEQKPLERTETFSEDFADIIGGESARSVSKKNAWCPMMTAAPDGSAYWDVSVFGIYGDPHSSILYRLLHFEHMNKGNMPDSCTKYLKDTKVELKFKSCLESEAATMKSSTSRKAAQ